LGGLKLIYKSKKNYKYNNIRLYINYDYEIKSINLDTFTIYDDIEKMTMKLDIEMLKHFQLPYSETCHSVQGMSIDEELTVFDCNISSHTDRYYVWTAITRATDLNNVTIFVYDDKEVEKRRKSKTRLYFKKTVAG